MEITVKIPAGIIALANERGVRVEEYVQDQWETALVHRRFKSQEPLRRFERGWIHWRNFQRRFPNCRIQSRATGSIRNAIERDLKAIPSNNY